MSYKTLSLVLAAAFASAPLAAQKQIGAGETVTGTLEEGDRQMEDGTYYDAYVIRGRPGERLVVRMTSDDFDTYLHWGRGDGSDWDEEAGNDDSGDGTDSRLVVRLDGSGEYELRAAGFDEGEEGEYELRVAALGEPSAGRIRAGQTVRGQLDENDYEGESGFEDHYVIEGTPGSQITVYAESDDFDTYLEFGTWAGGALEATAEDDDGGEGSNSEMLAEFRGGGVYHVVVRSYSGEESGDYTLRVVKGAVQDEWDDDGEGDPNEDEGHDHGVEDFSGAGYTIVPVRAGEAVADALDGEDPRDEDGAYYQEFSYRARAGERLILSVSSDEIDSYVSIGTGTYDEFDPILEDDDSGGDLNADLAWMVAEDGEYTIRVSTAAPDQTGPFVLRVRSTR